MELYPPSKEQKHIVDLLGQNNVVVDAVAGSGKTTTNLHIAKKYKNDKILLLTYNKDLKFDSRKKINQLGLTNIDVHSYHSFCVNNYYKKAYEDNGIIKILEESIEIKNRIAYDIVIIDEIQDLNILYYELICKLICDNEKECRLCLLGDVNQCINLWNLSDWRYLKFSEQLFHFNNFNWKKCTLSTSFRVTNQVANFVNCCMLKKNRINSTKQGEKVRYIICECFGNKKRQNRALEEVKYYLDKGYNYEDFFILAPSVKSGSKYDPPVRQLANTLSNIGIPIYVPNSDDVELDKKELIGKIVFSTFHQVKGRERKVVIIFNFDQSYFKYYARDRNIYECPNELYVATTRALECLSIFHHCTNDYLAFLNTNALRQIVYLEFDKNIHLGKNNKKMNLDTAVTDLTRHLPSKIMKQCLSYLDINKINDGDKFINIPRKIKQNGLVESVAEITGIAVPSYFEYLNTGKMGIYRSDLFGDDYGFITDSDDDSDDEFVEKPRKIDMNNLSSSDLLYISNKWNAYKTGYNFKLNQIKEYKWLSVENLKQCIQRLSHYVSKDAKYEVKFVLENEKELYNRKLKGFFDCLDNGVLWEFKCVKSLKKEHFLQLAIYMYMFKKKMSKNLYQVGDVVRFKYSICRVIGTIVKTNPIKTMINFGNREFYINTCDIIQKMENSKQPQYKFKLFNILSNQLFEIDSSIERLEEMIEFLINYKYFCKRKITDMEFINTNLEKYNKYFIED